MKRLLFICALVATAMSKSDSEATLKKGNDQFTAHMFQEVVKNQGDRSCVLSAFSVLSPLAELALASGSDATHDEILRTIGFPNDHVMLQVFSSLNARLRSLKGIDLELANKMYVREHYTVNKNFVNLTKDIFNIEFENIDFEQKYKAAAEINAWVEDHTHKRIKNVVSANSLDQDIVAFLVNAIYFKGKWKNPFEKSLTTNRSFHVTKDLTSPLPTMYQADDFKYAESKTFDAKFLVMEYEGSDASLVLALPNKIDGINDLIEKFKDPTALDNALKEMETYHVRVYLPKFKIGTTTNLVDVLKKMNINRLFQAKNADLDKLLTEKHNLYVSGATQKAFIEVNEEGAVAAAVNDFGLAMPDADIEIEYLYEPEFKADHPFLFFIMEQNNILFNGVFRS